MTEEQHPTTATSGWVGGAAARDGWGRRQGIHSPEDRRFVGLAAAALDDYLARNPVAASVAGDARFDDRLPDYSADGVAEQARVLNRHLLALDSINPLGLSRVNAVDLETLRRRLAARVYELRSLAEPSWNPLWWSPGSALEPLFARPDPPVAGIVARLEGLPEYLESARQSLATMPRPHLDRAVAETAAVPQWLAAAARVLAAQRPGAAADLEAATATATAALQEHAYWLAARRSRPTRDPRLGPRRYREVLDLVVGTTMPVAEIQRMAEAELEELSEQMRSLASQLLGRSMASRRLVPDALAVVAERYRLTPDELVPATRRAVVAARMFAAERRLVTLPEFEIEVTSMPVVRQDGGAVVLTTPGGLGPASTPTLIAVASPERNWPATRRESFLREYNATMIDALMAHQAVPGHALQAAHARAVVAPTAIRAVFPDPLFAEGWAVYAQDLMMREGFAGSGEGDATAFALQQVKLRMRGAVNALLDIGFHTQGMDEPRARRLLATAAMAEEGEVVGKWRRVQMSAGTLTTYVVGHHLMAGLVREVGERNAHWSARQVHDRLLMNGAVPPDAVRDLLGLV